MDEINFISATSPDDAHQLRPAGRWKLGLPDRRDVLRIADLSATMTDVFVRLECTPCSSIEQRMAAY